MSSMWGAMHSLRRVCKGKQGKWDSCWTMEPPASQAEGRTTPWQAPSPKAEPPARPRASKQGEVPGCGTCRVCAAADTTWECGERKQFMAAEKSRGR